MKKIFGYTLLAIALIVFVWIWIKNGSIYPFIIGFILAIVLCSLLTLIQWLIADNK